MIEKQVATLTAILKNKDIKNYKDEAFGNLIRAVFFGDSGAVFDAAVEVKELVFHMPTVIFWDKMKRFLFGTFRDYEDQVKMAEKFNKDNDDYEEFVKRQIYLIYEINDDKKIDCFSNLTRCFLLMNMEPALYFKLARYLCICTPEELEYIRRFDYNGISQNNAVISSLYQYGLFEPSVKNGKAKYMLSSFGKALKSNSLNYNDETNNKERLLSYEQLAPINITEPITWGEF